MVIHTQSGNQLRLSSTPPHNGASLRRFTTALDMRGDTESMFTAGSMPRQVPWPPSRNLVFSVSRTQRLILLPWWRGFILRWLPPLQEENHQEHHRHCHDDDDEPPVLSQDVR